MLPLGLTQPKEQPRLLQQLSRFYLLPFPRKKLGCLTTWTPHVKRPRRRNYPPRHTYTWSLYKPSQLLFLWQNVAMRVVACIGGSWSHCYKAREPRVIFSHGVAVFLWRSEGMWSRHVAGGKCHSSLPVLLTSVLVITDWVPDLKARIAREKICKQRGRVNSSSARDGTD